MYSNPPIPGGMKPNSQPTHDPNTMTVGKRTLPTVNNSNKKMKKTQSPKAKSGSPLATKKSVKSASISPGVPTSPIDREKSAAAINAMNAAAGHKNDKAAALAAAILRGVTMRPSGKWQAQLYYAGKSRYIGVFDTREKAALAYEIAREKLKTDKPLDPTSLSLKETEANVHAARKAAFEGVNEDPSIQMTA